MADGFVELNVEKLKTSNGVSELNRMLQHLYNNIAGDGENVKIFNGYGTPENVISASVGSIYICKDGGTGTSIYIKESGTGATGWVAK